MKVQKWFFPRFQHDMHALQGDSELGDVGEVLHGVAMFDGMQGNWPIRADLDSETVATRPVLLDLFSAKSRILQAVLRCMLLSPGAHWPGPSPHSENLGRPLGPYIR